MCNKKFPTKDRNAFEFFYLSHMDYQVYFCATRSFKQCIRKKLRICFYKDIKLKVYRMERIYALINITDIELRIPNFSFHLLLFLSCTDNKLTHLMYRLSAKNLIFGLRGHQKVKFQEKLYFKIFITKHALPFLRARENNNQYDVTISKLSSI